MLGPRLLLLELTRDPELAAALLAELVAILEEDYPPEAEA